MTYVRHSLGIATLLALAACTTTNERVVDAWMGASASNMVEAQTLNPRAATQPPALAPASGDGQRLQMAIDQYHKDVTHPDEKVSRPIVFEVGGH